MSTVIQKIASALSALRNCEKSGNTEWYQRWSETLDEIERNILPSGSGVDQGTTIDRDNPLPRQIRLVVPFHHMNGHGYYTVWETYEIIVTPDWDGVEIRVKGLDRNGVKDYLADVFSVVLEEPV